jgi:2-keto-4-pentenoate hydratase/2-oxohepta-3-ene-1,7-dioic acid hydratase in catechol pathway
MLHDIDTQLSTLSDWYALSPGDLVFTGTPEGVAEMVVGDVVEAALHTVDGRLVSMLQSRIG